jgi:hypothetical protein
LLHAEAKLRDVNVSIPEWMNDIVTKRNNLKAAFTVLYGILRRRIVVPSAYNPNGDRIPRDMVRVMSYMVLDTRFDPSWSLPAPAAPPKKLSRLANTNARISHRVRIPVARSKRQLCCS